MTGKTHAAAGILCGALISAQLELPFEQNAAVIACSFAGSLLPDIDICTSRLGRRIAPVSAAIQILVGHRTVFHGLLIYAIAAAFGWANLPDYRLLVFSTGAGVLSHLFLDALNPSGVPLFWPFHWRFRIAGFHTGGVFEWILDAVMLLMLMHLIILFLSVR